jgi:hypothetical protein
MLLAILIYCGCNSRIKRENSSEDIKIAENVCAGFIEQSKNNNIDSSFSFWTNVPFDDFENFIIKQTVFMVKSFHIVFRRETHFTKRMGRK